MMRSIRWTLLGWYAAILVVVISVLGVTLYVRQRAAAVRAIDTELQAHVLAVVNAIEWDEHDGFEFEFRGKYKGYFLQDGGDAPYLLIWSTDGTLLLRTPAAPTDVPPLPRPPVQSDVKREMASSGPGGTTILVGRGVQARMAEVAAFGQTVLLASAGALALALAGGWFLVRRVLRPIDRISASASRISAANLSERIDLGHTECELGRLGTTLNEAFDRLEEAVQHQVRFTADASHDLRTPLSVIHAGTEWALRKERTLEEYEETLHASERATHRMGTIVENLLQLTHADTRDTAPVSRPLDLADVANATATLLAPLAREHEVTLTVRSEPAPTRGEYERIDAAVIAVVSNAIVHGRRGGNVELRTTTESGSAVLEVRDDGPGIPSEDLPHIFERFFRTDRSRNARTGGSGLGLSVAQGIIEAHGGEIRVESTEGNGSVFALRLPEA